MNLRTRTQGISRNWDLVLESERSGDVGEAGAILLDGVTAGYGSRVVLSDLTMRVGKGDFKKRSAHGHPFGPRPAE